MLFFNKKIIFFDSKEYTSENGQNYFVSAYKLETNKDFQYNALGIVRYEDEQSDSYVSYNKRFVFMNNDKGLLLQCYCDDKDEIIYPQNMTFINYQSFKSEYQTEWKGNDKTVKNDKITVSVDLFNNYISVASKDFKLIPTVERQEKMIGNTKWIVSGYTILSSEDYNNFIVYETDKTVVDNNMRYSKVFILSKSDSLTKEELKKTQFYIDDITPLNIRNNK